MAGTALGALPAFAGGSMPETPPLARPVRRNDRPNILFVFTDQWRYDIFGYAGNKQVRTPYLDRLARQSMNFRRAYCPSPACGPSRASLFTGVYPAEHGHMRNVHAHDPSLPLFTDKLRGMDYHTGLVGKLHLHPIEASHGFDWKLLCDAHYDTYSEKEGKYNDYFDALAKMRPAKSREAWVEAGGRTEAMGPAAHEFWLGERWVDEAAHHTNWTADEAIRFLQRDDGSRPWFLNVSFFGPHHPYTTDFPWADFYPPSQMELPPTLNMEKKTPVFEALKRRIHSQMAAWDKNLWPKMIAQYYGYCSQIDLAVGRILTALAQRGDAENTWVIFTADHGDHLGNWGLLGKADPYETSIRVPLLICPPGGLAGGGIHDGVVNMMDLNGTILDMAGSTKAPRSLLPVVEGGAGPDGTFVFQGWAPDNYHATYVERERKLIATNRPDGRRLYEAYAIADDPWEKDDLWPEGQTDAAWRRMRSTLDEWCREQETAMARH